MARKLPVTAILNRTIVKDKSGAVVEGESRPYQFELRVGRLVLHGVWFSNTDEKSKEYFERFVDSLKMRDDIEMQVTG